MMATTVPIVLRPMTTRDIPAVTALEEEIYPQPWSSGIFSDELTQPGRAYLVAERGGIVVGYAGMMIVEDDAHVTTLTVAASARHEGLGSRLMLRLIDEGLEHGARHLTLEVRSTNAAARRLYERFGLTVVGVRKNYYRDDDAVIMWATDIDQADYQQRLEGLRSRGGGDG